jgi:hypothetical protein
MRSTNLAPGRHARGAFLVAVGVVLGLANVSSGNDEPAAREFFEAKIRPVLVARCQSCHSTASGKSKGGLKLDSRDALLEGGGSGPAIEPGNPDDSLLILAIEHADGVSSMPPKGILPPNVVADFRKWVADGAFDPRDGTSTAVANGSADWWSLKPLVRPEPPRDVDARTPIDAFVNAKLREKAMNRQLEADRRTLIRRLTLDLTGLPPTPAEIDAFLADSRPDAYERLVDRLLGSPQYGERSARIWMDLVHFAETHGHDQDRIRPNAWKYRDYLIESFNRDTPYARFVREQIAADTLFPEEPKRTVALGFLAAGPWDESSLRDIREDSIDREIGHYLDRDDIVTNVMSSFTSSTVHCARCHDHKFDPISQEDYYSLQAVFAGVEKGECAYDADPNVARRRKTLLATRSALQKREPELLASLEGPEIQSQVAAWEAARGSQPPTWTVLDPEILESAAGAKLTELPDLSVLSSGTRPDEDTYRFTTTTGLRGITAVRLEVLPDDRLPTRGPGRNENGNLHLTEFQVERDGHPLRVLAASADYDQPGWTVAAAIDGDPRTAWGIYPEVGKPHQAVFELEERGETAEPGRFTFVLRQTYPVAHPIGRFRLSVTDAPRPVRLSTVPDAIAAIVAIPEPQRTAEQRREIGGFVLAQTLERQLAELPPRELVYAAGRDFEPDGSHKPLGHPRTVNLLHRGDINQRGPEVVPGAISGVGGLPARFPADVDHEGRRRAALAEWIVDPKNPLTWRSIVNRVWQQHFGKGLVDTPSDFGRMGSLPSHPELLDWLAVEFRDGGGSIKHLHRRIVLSDAYRRASTDDPENAAEDADNRLLWRQNRRRLDAETVRDAIQRASGRLELTGGGPSTRQFTLSPGVHVTPVVDYKKYDWDSPGSGRRAVYRFIFRTLPDPFLDSLDAADSSQLTAQRNESATVIQSLVLLNNRFILHHAARFAERLEPSDDRIRDAFLWTLGRPPSDDERRDWTEYATKHGLANTCRLLFNSNEFLFAD